MFSSFFKTKPSTCVGLSIGASSIKMVEIKKKGKLYQLMHFGISELPLDVIVNREIINPVAVTESIKTLVHQMKLKTNMVCTALSGPCVLTKRMTLDISNEKEMQDQIFWEAEQYLPFDVSEVCMDYHIVSRSKNKKTDLLFSAVKKTLLESYVSCIEGAGLKALVVDLDFFALQHVYEAIYPTNPNEAIAIVDIGACSLKITIVQAGVSTFSKDCPVGGIHLTKEIQKNLNLSYSDAEALKIGSGGDEKMPYELSELIERMGGNFSNEIKKALDFYNASSAGAPVSSVLLAGGSAKLNGLSKMVEEVVGLPTQLIYPFNTFSYDPSVFKQDYLMQVSCAAAIPLGLALRVDAE